MRTPTFLVVALILSTSLMGCGGGGSGEEAYIGYEDGQHFGDDSWMYDPIFNKSLRLADFPHAADARGVQAGDERIAFQKGTGLLIARGQPIAGIQIDPTGTVYEDGVAIGWVVYTLGLENEIATQLMSPSGTALRFTTAPTVGFENSREPVSLATADRVPLNEAGIPAAAPTL